jgi:hypothetical protein
MTTNKKKCISYIDSYKKECKNSCNQYDTIEKQTDIMDKTVNLYIKMGNLKKLREQKIKTETLWKSSIACLSKRKQYRDECVEPKYRDEGHDKAIAIVEEKCVNFYGQLLLKIVNAINEIVVSRLETEEMMSVVDTNYESNRNDEKTDDDFEEWQYLSKEDLDEINNDDTLLDELIMSLNKDSKSDKFTVDLKITSETDEYAKLGTVPTILCDDWSYPEGRVSFDVIVFPIIKDVRTERSIRSFTVSVCLNPKNKKSLDRSVSVSGHLVYEKVVELMEKEYGYSVKTGGSYFITKGSVNFKHTKSAGKGYINRVRQLNKEVSELVHEGQYMMFIDIVKNKRK